MAHRPFFLHRPKLAMAARMMAIPLLVVAAFDLTATAEDRHANARGHGHQSGRNQKGSSRPAGSKNRKLKIK